MEFDTVITFITSLMTAMFTWIQQAVDFVVGNPLILFLSVGFFIAGGVIGLFHRLMRG